MGSVFLVYQVVEETHFRDQGFVMRLLADRLKTRPVFFRSVFGKLLPRPCFLSLNPTQFCFPVVNLFLEDM